MQILMPYIDFKNYINKISIYRGIIGAKSYFILLLLLMVGTLNYLYYYHLKEKIFYILVRVMMQIIIEDL